jgi:acyl-CoA thioester hydrolase
MTPIKGIMTRYAKKMVNNRYFGVIDVQGIVNNAVYIQYLEHARHKFLLERKVDFVDLSKQGKNLVVYEANYIYHKSLKPDDKFYVVTEVELSSKLKIAFKQKIFRASELILTAMVIGVCVDKRTNKISKILDILGPNFLES